MWLYGSLGRSEVGFAIFSLIMIAAFAYGLVHVFSGRAVYIHVGAVFGTIMVLNVWERILPAQRKMIAAAATGATFDPALGAQAKLRSKHNTFMAVPVFLLCSAIIFPWPPMGTNIVGRFLFPGADRLGSSEGDTPGLRFACDMESSADNR